MKIYLDFDGTVVEHKYPKIGAYNEGCKEVIEALHSKGHEIILNTYRANINKKVLQDSIDYLNKLLSFKITEVTKQKINPPKWNFLQSSIDQKLYIDDICEGCPLKPTIFHNSNWVDWSEVENQLKEHNIL